MLRRDPRLGQPPLREQLAQPQRVLAVGLRAPLAPRNARVSTVSARCATPPARATARATNSQPVHASIATCTSRPQNRPTHSSTATGDAPIRPRQTSPVAASKQSNVICRKCTSNPAMIAPANRGETTPAAFWATDDIPSFTVGTSCSIGRPRGSYPRAPNNALRHGGPATFTPGHPPESRAVHSISVARAAVRSLLLHRCSGVEQKPPLGVAGYIETPGGRVSGNFAAQEFEGPRTSVLANTIAGLRGRVAASGSSLRSSWPSSARTKRR